MASRRQAAAPSLKNILDEMRSHNVLLEDMQSQNRATIEAVEAARLALEQRFERLDQETRSRDSLLELALRDLKVTVQENTVDIRGLKAAVQENSVDIRGLKAAVQENSVDIRGLRTGFQENSSDIRALATKVEALAQLEVRVSALERGGP